MAYAHQIIYTSCRRGIESAGDGLQVFSYDGSLPEAGFDVGVGFHRLLPFDVLVGTIYPYTGYLGIAFLIIVAVKSYVIDRVKKA